MVETPKQPSITVRLPDDLRRRLRVRAAERSETLTSLMIRALQRELQHPAADGR